MYISVKFIIENVFLRHEDLHCRSPGGSDGSAAVGELLRPLLLLQLPQVVLKHEVVDDAVEAGRAGRAVRRKPRGAHERGLLLAGVSTGRKDD